MAYAEIGADLNGTDVRLEAMVIQEVDGADGIDHGCRPDLRPSCRQRVRPQPPHHLFAELCVFIVEFFLAELPY